MNRFIYALICSLLCSTPFHSFELNENSKMLSRSNGSFPDSNGIIELSRKFEKDIGYVPSTSLEEGLKKTIEWYRVSRANS